MKYHDASEQICCKPRSFSENKQLRFINDQDITNLNIFTYKDTQILI